MQEIGNKRIQSLDVLKGIAIIMIILVHSRQSIPGGVECFRIFEFGQMGCQIFFVVSGYSISRSWKNYINRDIHDNFLYKDRIKRFYLKRFSTIAPGFYFTILVSHVLNCMMRLLWGCTIGFAENSDVISVLCNILFLHGLLPFCNNTVAPGGWYIGTLAIFYLCFPLVYFCFSKLKIVRNIIPFLVCFCSVIFVKVADMLWGYGDSLTSNNGFFYFSFVVQFPCFALGILLSMDEEEKMEKSYFINFLIGGGLMFCAIFLFFYNIIPNTFIVLPTIVGYSTYFILKYVLSIVKKKSVNKEVYVIQKWGENSYYIYLSHGFFVWTLPIMVGVFLDKFNIHINSILLYIIFLPFMFGFSYYVGLVLKRVCYSITERMNKQFGLM